MVRATQLQPGLVFDGYTLVRPLGQGGFGTVWLTTSGGTGAYHAFKWISGGALEHECSAVKLFRKISQCLRSPHLIAIEHINRTKDALYYTMPLADGGPGSDPTASNWAPLTLADRIEQKKSEDNWFSISKILTFFLPVAHVAVSLNREGLVHRDIKPANILFFGGLPCLSDIGLLGNDRPSLSIKGTPGHVPPSWYEGEPDMWGLATTLYVLLTGNPPDTMGRANFRWPYGNKNLLTLAEQKEWQRLHNIILRATAEGSNERYIGLEAFVKAVTQNPTEPPPLPSFATFPKTPRSKNKANTQHSKLRAISLGTLLGILLVAFFVMNFNSTSPFPAPLMQEASPISATPPPPSLPATDTAQNSEEITILQNRVETLHAERLAEQQAEMEHEAWKAAATPEMLKAQKDAETTQKLINENEAYLRKMLSLVPSQPDTQNKIGPQNNEDTSP